jgi:hypothetical protein
MKREIQVIWFVSPLVSHTSCFKGFFLVQCLRNHNTPDAYASGVTQAANDLEMATIAARNSGQYEYDQTAIKKLWLSKINYLP